MTIFRDDYRDSGINPEYRHSENIEKHKDYSYQYDDDDCDLCAFIHPAYLHSWMQTNLPFQVKSQSVSSRGIRQAP